MANTAHAANEADATIGVRLPTHIIDAIKAKRAAMAKAMPGAAITISDAVRALLLAGLAAES